MDKKLKIKSLGMVVGDQRKAVLWYPDYYGGNDLLKRYDFSLLRKRGREMDAVEDDEVGDVDDDEEGVDGMLNGVK